MIDRTSLRADTILHVGRPSAFVDFALKRFEAAAPSRNVLLALETSGSRADEHPLGIPMVFAGDTAASVFAERARIRAAGAIIVHALSPLAAVVVLLARRRTVIVWSGWGDDYYGGFWDARAGLIGAQTRAVVHDSRPWLDRFATAVKRGRHSLVRRIAARRADFFSAPISSDLDVVTSSFGAFRGAYLPINYASVGDLEKSEPQTASAEGILLGNSASPTNNLLEALEQLSTLDLYGRRVIVPLSYGHSGYRRAVVERGYQLLGDAFLPLETFMPLEQYFSIVRGCDVVIMNHWRQQGLGNVIAALHSGSRVVLDRKNPLLDFCRERALTVFSWEDLSDRSFLQTPPPIDIGAQREALLRIWGEEVVDRHVRTAIETIDETRHERSAVGPTSRA